MAVRKSAVQRAHSEDRLAKLQFLRSPQMETLLNLPEDFLSMYDAVTSLPPHDPSAAAELQLSAPLPEPGKRPWETNKMGYLKWAVEQLLFRTRGGDQGAIGTSSAVGSVAAATAAVARAQDVKATLQMLGDSPVGERSMDLG